MLREGTLSNLVQYWIDNVKVNNVKAGTLNRLRSEAKALEAFPIANMKVNEIQLFHVQAYVNELVAAGYSFTTIAKQRLVVTAPLRYAYNARIIFHDCTRGIEMPSKDSALKPEREVLPLTVDEQEAFLAVIRKDARPTSPLLEFVLHTGLRVGEAQALSWKNVNFQRKCITVAATALNSRQSDCLIQNSPKTKSSKRTIPVNERALEILREAKQRSNQEFVFCDENGSPLNYGRIAKHYKSACKRANVPHYGVHSLRHTFATNCYYKGCDVKILSKLLGHSSVTITYNTYINLYGDALEDMRAAIS